MIRRVPTSDRDIDAGRWIEQGLSPTSIPDASEVFSRAESPWLASGKVTWREVVAAERATRATKHIRKRRAAKTKVKADGLGRPTRTPLSQRG